MKLRNVTIWATGLMMVMPLVFPIIFMSPSWGNEDIEDLINVPLFSLLLSGTPLLVSLTLAKNLKYRVSTVILLVSTVTYSIWFTIVCFHVYLAISAGRCGCVVMVFFAVGPLSLPVMIPAWITALLLDSHYVKKSATDP